MTSPPTYLVGPIAETNPHSPGAYVIERKKAWADEWIQDFTLWGDHCELPVGGAGKSILVFHRDFGPGIKQEYESAFATVARIDLTGWWVRLRVFGESTNSPLVTEFMGRVRSGVPEYGGTTSRGTLGVERWLAFGAEYDLDQAKVTSSYWDGVGTEIGWLPDFNIRRGERNEAMMLGNRTTIEGTTGAFEFGGNEEWTNRQILDYVVAFYLQFPAGPVWRVAGDMGVLDTIVDRMHMPAHASVAGLLRSIIRPSDGLDYFIQTEEDGFSIRVFAIVPENSSYAGLSIPGNPNISQRDVSTDAVADYKPENTTTQKYDRFRMIGRRVKTVFSVACDQAPTVPQMIQGWTPAIETAYRADTDDGRVTDKYRDVFARFVVNPTWWRGSLSSDARPNLSGGADANAKTQLYTLVPVLGQALERRTLDGLVLQAGGDYTVDPPSTPTATGAEISYLPPMFFLLFGGKYYNAAQLSQIDDAAPNFHIHALKNDLGLQVSALPRHLLGKGHWNAATPAPVTTAFNPDTNQGGKGLFKWDESVATLCGETDQRISLDQELPDDEKAGDGSVMIEEVDDAEFWWLAPNTVVGVDANGVLLRAPSAGVVLRDDTERLAKEMQGKIVAYMSSRRKASCTFKKLAALSGLLGTVVEWVTATGAKAEGGSVVTSVVHNLKTMQTTIRTGYSRT